MKNIPRSKGLITIQGTQVVDGQKEAIELLTDGTYAVRDGNFYICYNESEATGFKGSHTTLKYDPAHDQVTLTRRGSTRSQLIIEAGRRHQCSYDTGYGNLVLGINGNHIESTLGETGGKISFHYSLDVNTVLASENGVSIQVVLDGAPAGGSIDKRSPIL